MDALRTRIDKDINNLENLSWLTHGKVRIISTSGTPVNRIDVELNFATVPSRNYPAQRQNLTIAVIDLPAKYPFSQPRITITPPIFHPNVYKSGLVDLGTRCMPTEFLDLLVKRLVQILTFDPTGISVNSPSNFEAANWYMSMIRTNPTLFPTEILDAVFPPQSEKPKFTN